MSKLSVLDLQYLVGRLSQREEFSFRELQIIDYATELLSSPHVHSSQMANLSNQIWLLLGEQGDNYLNIISYIISECKNLQTKSMAITSLAHRIAIEWRIFDRDKRSSISIYMINLIQDIVAVGDRNMKLDTLLRSANTALIAMLKYEWDGLFKEFIRHMAETFDEMGNQTVVNNFQILRMLLEEGFGCRDQQMNTEEWCRFQNSLEDDMRSILKIICQCLENGENTRKMVVTDCLRMLRETLHYIPAFELFNCNLIDILLNLIRNEPSYYNLLFSCIEEIFNFQQKQQACDQHNKIAKKLLTVLDFFLNRYENAQRGEIYDKQSGSTLDSMDSLATRKPNSLKFNINPFAELLTLLHLFLARYVPFMNSSTEQSSLQIQSDSSVKLTFDRQLYANFTKDYKRFITFLLSYINKYIGFNLNTQDEQSMQNQVKVLECCKLMLMLLGKLSMMGNEIGELMEMMIMKLTPVCKVFKKYYLQLEIMVDGRDRNQINAYFSDQYYCCFNELMGLVLKSSKTKQMYVRMVQQKLEQIRNVACTAPMHLLKPRLENIPPREIQVIQKMSKNVEIANNLNRLCWNIVIAYNMNEQSASLLKISKIISLLIKDLSVLTDPLLRKCFSTNSKYLSLADDSDYNKIVGSHMSFICSTKSQTIMQFMFIILSRIFVKPNFSVYDLDVYEMQEMITQIHRVEIIGTYSQDFIQIYPAMYALFLKMWEMLSKGEGYTKVINSLKNNLIDNQLAKINQILKHNSVDSNNPNNCNQASIYLFQRLHQISIYLVGVCNNSVNGKIQRGLSHILKSHLTLMNNAIFQFQFKYTQYSEYLLNERRQTFQNSIINLYRQKYCIIVSDYIELNIVRIKTFAIDSKNNMDRRALATQQKRQTINKCQIQLFNDFSRQREFKCQNYFGCILSYFKWLIIIKSSDGNSQINSQINTIALILMQQQTETYEYLKNKKYMFWKQIISLFLFQLNSDNIMMLVQMLKDIGSKISQMSAKNIQNMLELLDTVFKHLIDNDLESSKNPPPIWLAIPEIFITTFYLLFQEISKNQIIFTKIAEIFYRQIIVISRCKHNIFRGEQYSKNNDDVLYIMLRQRIMESIPLIDERECLTLLQNMIKARDLPKFICNLRDLVIYIQRVVANQSSQGNSSIIQ